MAVETRTGIGQSPPLAPASGHSPTGKFTLVNLCGGPTIEFKFFPTPPISLSGRVDWQEQEVTIGAKPLFYFNRSPHHVDVGELWIDQSDTGSSITPTIDSLKALQEPSCQGAPPPLLAIWGDRRERVVLDEFHVDEQFHLPSGVPIRAKITLGLKEIQE